MNSHGPEAIQSGGRLGIFSVFRAICAINRCSAILRTSCEGTESSIIQQECRILELQFPVNDYITYLGASYALPTYKARSPNVT